MSQKWDERFMAIARQVSTWSKDPSTQCGSIIVDPDRHPISVGYNGLPKHMADDPEILYDREKKYEHIIHAEDNAIENSPVSVEGCTLYVTHPCCTVCAEKIIKHGIIRVVMDKGSDDFIQRWNCLDSIRKLKRAGIQVTQL